MKICVSTVYDANNCGAFLQAYALKKTLESMGHKVVHLKYLTKKERKHKIFQYDTTNKLQYLKRHLGFSYKNYRLYEKAIEYFNVITKEDLPKCDCLIIGSDELWNVTNENVFDYLNNISYDNEKKIAYAVSCGNATYEDLIKYPQVLSDIKTIDKIYPRDKFTKTQIEKVVGRKCMTVCDPTFLLNIDRYESASYKRLPFDYIMYYGYWSEENTINHLKKYSRQQNLEICSIGMKNFRIDKNYLCHPLNFPKYIADSQLMVTSTFHGTIFSILTHSNFICIDFGNTKVKMLLEEMGLEDRLLKSNASYDEFISLINSKIDYSIIEEKIKEMRSNGLNALNNIFVNE